MKARVFVKINEYEQLSAHLEKIVDQLKKSKTLLEEINSLKIEEDHILQEWADELKQVEERISQIDETLIEHENE
ncbi:hypothetical protein HY837_05815 [archaeon]|nr:hypothetical protein [archaeon]